MAKKKKHEGRTLYDILHVAKKKNNVKGRTPRDTLQEWVNAPNGTFSTLHFATVSLHIHVEFVNDERGKEKDR